MSTANGNAWTTSPIDDVLTIRIRCVTLNSLILLHRNASKPVVCNNTCTRRAHGGCQTYIERARIVQISTHMECTRWHQFTKWRMASGERRSSSMVPEKRRYTPSNVTLNNGPRA